jgi:hypothetical protein
MIFLNEHPAMTPNQFFRGIDFSIQDVCKRGYDRIVARTGVDIYPSDKNAHLFKEEFDREFEKEYKELEKNYKNEPKMLRLQKRFVKITVPYKKLFGEPWKYDRTEWWGEMTFFVYHGNPQKWMKDMNPYTWQAYSSHLSESAPSFEELLVKLANRFRKRFGDFEREDFLTPEEKKNHRTEEAFWFKRKKEKHFSTLKWNPKYIRVPDPELNHRWAQWFLSTPYGKKAWGDSDMVKIMKIRKTGRWPKTMPV